jgi:uridylate kinase
MLKYKRVLLKLSGEGLSSPDTPIDPNKVVSLAKQIVKLQQIGVEISIVIGGGNFFRGRDAKIIGFDRYNSDYMGMLGTIMNSLALASALNSLKVTTQIFSALEIKGIVNLFDRNKALEYLKQKDIILFAGGTGHPFFSTDTTAALRAIEIDSQIILMAKNGVDGVYDEDPRLNKAAKKYDKITYKEMINNNIHVMDATAVTLCMDNNVEILVFDALKENAFCEAVEGKSFGTLIYGGK